MNKAQLIAERIVQAYCRLGALLDETDFDRAKLITACTALLQRGFVFPEDDDWYYKLDADTAPDELKSLVDDLWVATGYRNGTPVRDPGEMAWVLGHFGSLLANAPLRSVRSIKQNIVALPYPLVWLGARIPSRSLDHAPVVVDIVDAAGTPLTLCFDHGE
jgi:hypothetical protein